MGWLGGLIAAAVGAFLVWKFGFSDSSPTPSIDGPTTVQMGLPGLPGSNNPTPFVLTGHSDGGYRQMYWIDAYGRDVSYAGDGVGQQFYCVDAGSFEVSLIEISNSGHRGKTTQTINCVR